MKFLIKQERKFSQREEKETEKSNPWKYKNEQKMGNGRTKQKKPGYVDDDDDDKQNYNEK